MFRTLTVSDASQSTYACLESLRCSPLDRQLAHVGAVVALLPSQSEVGHFGDAIFRYKYVSGNKRRETETGV